MGTERLVVEFERQDDGGVVLRLSGRLERATAALLEGALYALRGDPVPVVLDLSDVDHIDSYGLDVLLEAESEGRRRRSPVDVIGVRESLRTRRSPLDDA
jgi:anti-anti-sigma factor